MRQGNSAIIRWIASKTCFDFFQFDLKLLQSGLVSRIPSRTLLLGETGAGISILGNCLLGFRGDNGPFKIERVVLENFLLFRYNSSSD